MSYISIKLKIVTATVLFLYSRGKNGNKMLCNIVQFCAREYFFFFFIIANLPNVCGDISDASGFYIFICALSCLLSVIVMYYFHSWNETINYF